MTKEILLHIGTPKTGTSSLQYLFAKNLEKFEHHGIVYPNLTGAGFGWTVERGLGSGNADVTWNIKWDAEDRVKRIKWLIEKALETESGSNAILLSTEFLSSIVINPAFWSMLQELKSSEKCDFRIVGYVRDPFAYFLSSYRQYVKAHAFSGMLSDYISPFWDSNSPLSFRFYKNLVQIQENSRRSGVELILYRYEDGERNIENHFLSEILGLKVDEFEVIESQANVGMNTEHIHFHRGVNSVSHQMGYLLGYERGDLLLNSLRNEESRTSTKLFMPLEEQERLQTLFDNYRPIAEKVLPFADKVNYAVQADLITSELDSREMEFMEELYRLGVFVGTSFEGGYLHWGREKHKFLDPK